MNINRALRHAGVADLVAKKAPGRLARKAMRQQVSDYVKRERAAARQPNTTTYRDPLKQEAEVYVRSWMQVARVQNAPEAQS